MELILDLLRRLPDYPRLRTALESAQAVGVSGAAQINPFPSHRGPLPRHGPARRGRLSG